MPLADDATTPAPTAPIKIKPPPKKRTPTKKSTPIIGPVAPQIAAQQSPTRVSKPASSPQQSPVPTYTSIFTKKEPIRFTKPEVGKSSNTVTDFIRGLRERNSSDFYQTSTSGLQFDQREDETPAVQEVSGEDALSYLLTPGKREGSEPLGRTEDLQKFLQRIMPEGYDPEYGGVTMPEAWKHRKNDINQPLKPHWDAKQIAANLSDFDPGSSYARFAMNDILKKQMWNQSNWVKEQTLERALRVKDFLEEASDDAFDGDFNTLREKLEKNPDFLEFARYKDEYTTSPEEVMKNWQRTKGQFKDEWVKKAMRSRTDTTRKHYEYVRKFYNDARSIANRAIKQYEKKYNRSVEFAGEDAKDVGPAIPVKKNEDKSLLDSVAKNREANLAEFYGGESAERNVHHEQRKQAAKRLGVQYLPSVKDMLAALVSQGQVDPDNEKEIEAWVNRLQNPNHPDTRALYVAFARNENKKLDVEGDALDFINEPINNYVAEETERARSNAKAAKVKAREEIEGDNFTLFAGSLAGGTAPISGIDEVRESAKETEYEDHVDMVNKMGWTFDKLMRLNYGVAGFTDAIYRIDEDDSDAPKAWYQKGPDVIGFMTGKNLSDSIDEVWNSPSKLGDPFKEGYKQVFRGSGFKGTSDDTVPITFSQVIANNAQWDTEDNIYDKEWYQHVAGTVLDIGTDPLNFVGVGVVSNTMKVPVRVAAQVAAKRGLSEAAITPAKFIQEITALNKSAAAEKSFRVQQVLARQGDMVHGDAILTERGVTPFEFTVEYAKNSTPVGNAASVPEYTNARYFSNTKPDAAQINAELRELAVLKEQFPAQVALESHEKELLKIMDDLDLGDDIKVPEIRVRTLMAQNSTPINVKGVEGLKLDNPGGMFHQRVLKPLEEATAKWSGHRSTTRFAEFTDEAGKTRLTNKAAAARRAIDEEETYYRLGQTAPKEVQARWAKALDEAGDVDPNTGKPSMWQEYDVEHYLDEGAPGLVPSTGWSPLKAYAKAAGVKPEVFERFWSEADIIRSLKRGPEMLKKVDPEYAKRIEDSLTKIRHSKEKLATTTKPNARAAAYRALAMGYQRMSEATLEGSFRYLDMLRNGSDELVGSVGSITRSEVDELIEQGGNLLEQSYAQVDDINGYIGEGFNGSYSGIDPSGYKSFEEMLNTVDSAEFPSKSAQVQSLIDELENYKKNIVSDPLRYAKVYEMTNGEVLRLDSILPVKSQFRKSNGDFDVEKIKSALTHNKTDIETDNSKIFKVEYKLPKPTDADEVALARYQREARFLDVIAKRVEEKANDLYQVKKTEIVDAKKVKKGSSEAVERLEDEVSTFWTYRKEGKEADGTPKLVKQGPSEAKVGPKPTRADVEAEFPNTFKQERARSVADRNKNRNEEAILKDKISGSERIAKWDAGRGMSTAAERRIQAVLKGKVRRWEKARRTAQENDAARFKQLQSDLRSAKNEHKDFQLTLPETQTVYRNSFNDARDLVVNEINDTKTLIANGANARLTLGETTSAMHKRAAAEIKFEELKLKIAKAETAVPEELAAIEAKRKALIKKKIALYDRVRKAKMEAQGVRVTMMHRVGEEHLIQAITMPERMDGRVLQFHIFGMKKNLQFTSAMFRGAELAEKYLPARVWAAYQDNWVRPSKQLKSHEAIEMRARWESKTPVLVHARLQKLTKAMANTTESERSGMLMAYRKGVPYGGPKQLEFQRVVENLEEIMDIINGSHIGYMFTPLGRTTAEPLSLYEISRFLPKEYSFDPKVLDRFAADRPPSKAKSNTDPFGPTPEPRSDFTFDELMSAIEVNGSATPKDLIDPFRVSWVYSLAAEQASQYRALTKSIGETFGVLRPAASEKSQLWLKLQNEHNWEGVKDIPGVLFPPEVVKEVNTLLKFTQPGPESMAITRMMDQAIGYWKQGMTIYNPAYYTRNGIGEMMVSWLDGVNSPKWYRMASRVHKYTKKTDQDLADLVSKYDVLEGKIPVDVAKGNEVLFNLKGGLKVRIEDVLKEYVDQGLKSTFVNTDLGQGVRGLANQSLESNKVRRGIQATNNKVHEVGEGFEDWLRMAHFMHAMQHSGKGSLKEAASYAASRVRRSHFDYTDFSDAEKAIMLRAFPFYKWVRRGAPLMVQHLFMTPGKMAAAPKIMDGMSGLGLDPINAFNEGPVLDTQDVYEDKNGNLPNYTGIAPAWIRDLFAYQMQPAADDEYANFFRVNLPQFDGLQGLLSFAEGNFGDSTANTLMNPFLKAPLELGLNKRLDPDSNFEIYGGEFNEQMGISNPEAIGAYLGQVANPLTSFLSKLSKNGKLPVGNISNGESDRDATRDVLSYLTGLGFYQTKLGAEEASGSDASTTSPPAVGPYEASEIPVLSGRAALSSGMNANDKAIKKLLKENGAPNINPEEAADAKGWIDFPDRWRKRWKDYGSSGGYGGYSSGSWDLLELLRRLKEQIDQGRVIDPDVFRSE